MPPPFGRFVCIYKPGKAVQPEPKVRWIMFFEAFEGRPFGRSILPLSAHLWRISLHCTKGLPKLQHAICVCQFAYPVFVIPKNYILKNFSTICYASDIENIDVEIKKVVELADSLKAKVTVLHYDYDSYLKLDKEKLNNAARKYESEKILFEYKKLNPKYTLNYHIRKDVLLIKPSLVVLFTKQNRNWFDRLFETHHSSNMSFNTKVPLLIFRKKEKKS